MSVSMQPEPSPAASSPSSPSSSRGGSGGPPTVAPLRQGPVLASWASVQTIPVVTLVVGFALLLIVLFDRDVKLDLSIGGIKAQSAKAVYDIGLVALAIVWAHLARLMAEAARLAAAGNDALSVAFSPEASQKGAEVSRSQVVDERSVFHHDGAQSPRLYALYWIFRVAEHWSAYLFLLGIVLSTAAVLIQEGVKVVRNPSMPMPGALAIAVVMALFLAKGGFALAQYWLLRRRDVTLEGLLDAPFEIGNVPKKYSATDMLLYIAALVIGIPTALVLVTWDWLLRRARPWRRASAVKARKILRSSEAYWLVGIRSVEVTSIAIEPMHLPSGRRLLAGESIGPRKQAIDICILSTAGTVQLEGSFVPLCFCNERFEHRVAHAEGFQHAEMGSDPNSYLMFQDTEEVMENIDHLSKRTPRERTKRRREAEIQRIYKALTSGPLANGVFLGAEDGGLFSQLQERVPPIVFDADRYFSESLRKHLNLSSLLHEIGVSDRLLARADLPAKEKALALLENVRVIAARWPKAEGKSMESIAAEVRDSESTQ